MRSIRVLFLAVVVCLAATGARAADDVLIGYLRHLADRAALMSDDMEVAAFLVDDGQGGLTCRMWPHSANRLSEHFEGAIPDGTVAIAHSHPYNMPLPSRSDIDLSRRLGLPVYVVSRWEVHVIEPSSGNHTMFVRGRPWTHPSGERHECSEQASGRRPRASVAASQ